MFLKNNDIHSYHCSTDSALFKTRKSSANLSSWQRCAGQVSGGGRSGEQTVGFWNLCCDDGGISCPGKLFFLLYIFLNYI